jgi:hypothetical protein
MTREVNSISVGTSRKNRPPTRLSSFYCSPEYHLQRMRSGLAPSLWGWGRRLSSVSECFWPSINQIAEYFNRDRTTVMRALFELVGEEWAEVIDSEPGKTVNYRFLSHDEWAKKHPGKCVVKERMPWDGEGDVLGARLYAISGGRAKFLPNQMNGLRKFGFEDDTIATEFKVFLDRNPIRGAAWRGVYFRFHDCLAVISDDITKANSRSNQSHPRDPHQSLRRDHASRTHATPTSRTGATQVVELSFEAIGRGRDEIPASPSAHAAACLDSHPLKAKGAAPPSTPAENQEHACARAASEKLSTGGTRCAR